MEKQSLQREYEMIKSLGQGNHGSVFLARSKSQNKLWAVKEIPLDKNCSMPVEVELLKKLYHPFLPTIQRIFIQTDLVSICMDYVQGETLGNLLKKVGCLEIWQVVDLGIRLCKVLIYLHRQKPTLIYRDLKPDNIMVQENGQIKLVDFGAIFSLQSGRKNDCMGTPGYAAPEQYARRKKLGTYTDVFCLGKTLQQCLLGNVTELKLRQVLGCRIAVKKRLMFILWRCTRRQTWLRMRDCQKVLKGLQKLASAYG